MSSRFGFFGTNLDTVSNAVSIVSVAAANATSIANAVSAKADTLSNQISVLSQQVSILSQSVSVLSQSLSVLSQSVSVLSQSVSVLSQAVSVVSAKIDTLSNQISVLSQSLSVLSQAVSVVSQSVSVLSQAVSVISAGLGAPQKRVTTNNQTMANLGLANVSGLSASVASTATYQIDGRILATASSVINLGLTFPAGIVAGGFCRVDGTTYNTARIDGAASGSILISVNIGASVTQVTFEGVFQVSTTAGVIQLQAGTSNAAKAATIFQGSMLRAYKIA